MKKEKFCEIIGEIDEDYIKGARENMKAKKKLNYKAFGAIAACFCVLLCGTLFMKKTQVHKPNPQEVQVVNPLLEVSSIEEMEKYLDFSVPVLEKDVNSYIVIVMDNRPESGRIEYSDGSTFDIKYGSGDISGIYGGELESEKTVNGVKVSYLKYEDVDSKNIHYAIWEKDGFTFSLSNSPNLEAEVDTLTK